MRKSSANLSPDDDDQHLQSQREAEDDEQHKSFEKDRRSKHSRLRTDKRSRALEIKTRRFLDRLGKKLTRLHQRDALRRGLKRAKTFYFEDLSALTQRNNSCANRRILDRYRYNEKFCQWVLKYRAHGDTSVIPRSKVPVVPYTKRLYVHADGMGHFRTAQSTEKSLKEIQACPPTRQAPGQASNRPNLSHLPEVARKAKSAKEKKEEIVRSNRAKKLLIAGIPKGSLNADHIAFLVETGAKLNNHQRGVAARIEREAKKKTEKYEVEPTTREDIVRITQAEQTNMVNALFGVHAAAASQSSPNLGMYYESDEDEPLPAPGPKLMEWNDDLEDYPSLADHRISSIRKTNKRGVRVAARTHNNDHFHIGHPGLSEVDKKVLLWHGGAFDEPFVPDKKQRKFIDELLLPGVLQEYWSEEAVQRSFLNTIVLTLLEDAIKYLLGPLFGLALALVELYILSRGRGISWRSAALRVFFHVLVPNELTIAYHLYHNLLYTCYSSDVNQPPTQIMQPNWMAAFQAKLAATPHACDCAFEGGDDVASVSTHDGKAIKLHVDSTNSNNLINWADGRVRAMTTIYWYIAPASMVILAVAFAQPTNRASQRYIILWCQVLFLAIANAHFVDEARAGPTTYDFYPMLLWHWFKEALFGTGSEMKFMTGEDYGTSCPKYNDGTFEYLGWCTSHRGKHTSRANILEALKGDNELYQIAIANEVTEDPGDVRDNPTSAKLTPEAFRRRGRQMIVTHTSTSGGYVETTTFNGRLPEGIEQSILRTTKSPSEYEFVIRSKELNITATEMTTLTFYLTMRSITSEVSFLAMLSPKSGLPPKYTATDSTRQASSLLLLPMASMLRCAATAIETSELLLLNFYFAVQDMLEIISQCGISLMTRTSHQFIILHNIDFAALSIHTTSQQSSSSSHTAITSSGTSHAAAASAAGASTTTSTVQTATANGSKSSSTPVCQSESSTSSCPRPSSRMSHIPNTNFQDQSTHILTITRRSSHRFLRILTMFCLISLSLLNTTLFGSVLENSRTAWEEALLLKPISALWSATTVVLSLPWFVASSSSFYLICFELSRCLLCWIKRFLASTTLEAGRSTSS